MYDNECRQNPSVIQCHYIAHVQRAHLNGHLKVEDSLASYYLPQGSYEYDDKLDLSDYEMSILLCNC